MSVSPRAADWIRKACAYLIAGVGTVFLLRVMFRLANGKQRLLDPELFLVVALAVLMTVWVLAAKPVRRRARESRRPDEEGETQPAPDASDG